jgi:hypothetical protein
MQEYFSEMINFSIREVASGVWHTFYADSLALQRGVT